MRPIIESKPRSYDHPSMQRYAGRPRPAKIVEVVADVFESPLDIGLKFCKRKNEGRFS